MRKIEREKYMLEINQVNEVVEDMETDQQEKDYQFKLCLVDCNKT